MSCLVDRSSSKIAFISSAEGGVDIEDVAKNNPDTILTVKIDLSNTLDENHIRKIIRPFDLLATIIFLYLFFKKKRSERKN